MKLVLQIVLLFILAIIIGTLCSYGPGHVILLIDKYRVDLSVITLLLVILVIYLILHYIFIFFGGVYHIPARIRQYQCRRALIKSRNYFNMAATNYFQGEYQKAYNNALKSMSQNVLVTDKFPVLLLAIDALHLMGDSDKKLSAKLNNLVSKFANGEEQRYVYNELAKINKTKNNRLYTEILTKLSIQ